MDVDGIFCHVERCSARQAPTHLLSQNRKMRARCDILVIEPNSDTPLYCHVILNLNFSYFVTAAGKNLCGSMCMFGWWHAAFGILCINMVITQHFSICIHHRKLVIQTHYCCTCMEVSPLL